jgi:L-amino acid N-acyltransferase YncA
MTVPDQIIPNTDVDILIRPVRLDDAEGVVAMWNPIIESGQYTSFDAPFTPEAERAYIESMSARHIFHVAERRHDGRIVGFQSGAPFPAFSNSFAHVSMLSTFVDMNFHRQGIAKRLFPVTFATARQMGFEKFFTYVRADNINGLATYLSQGFRIIGTAQRQAKMNGRYIDEIIIEKLL